MKKWTVPSVAGRCLANRRRRWNWRNARCRRDEEPWSSSGPPADASRAGGSFSPADERLKLGGEGYSPGLLKKIEYAGGNTRSFEMGAQTLERLAECSISARHVERLTERLGQERAAIAGCGLGGDAGGEIAFGVQAAAGGGGGGGGDVGCRQRKMYAAKKRAVMGDGGNWIEPLGQMHFPGWLQILDFLHLLVHLYAAARLALVKNPRAAWKLYERMLRDAWGGKVQAVIDALR